MNIFIANLNYKVRGQKLKEVFQEYGEVTNARIIIDRKTRRSKGFGFVEMPNEIEGQKAINELNGTELMGREIVVQQSHQKEGEGMNKQDEATE
jgi:RNA recognition motif-containing protein